MKIHGARLPGDSRSGKLEIPTGSYHKHGSSASSIIYK